MSLITKIENRRTKKNKKLIREVQEILPLQFPGLDDAYVANLPLTVFCGPKMGFSYRFYVSEDDAGKLEGFLIYSYFQRYNFFFLDHLAAAPGLTGKGVGGRLYSLMRERAKNRGVTGIFFECLNDDPLTANGKEEHAQSQSRLKFYERFGARPLANNLFEAKVKDKGNSTLLVLDPLDKEPLISRDFIRKIVRKIILKKYSDFCPPDHIKKVVSSFKDDPVLLRDYKYVKPEPLKVSLDPSLIVGKTAF